MQDSFSTRWENPTKDVVRFRVLVEAGRFEHVEIGPGATKDLPSSWDPAVHDVRGGVVMGGLAPQLVKAGQVRLPVHSSITEAAAGAVHHAEKLEAERTRAAKAEAEAAELRAKLLELENKLTAPPAGAPAARGR